MVRPRVFSFMSKGGNSRPASPPSPPISTQPQVNSSESPRHSVAPWRDAPSRPASRADRISSRPLSMVQTWQPPVTDVQDTIPELQPIFTFLNSHSNKLYTEGYFLKLNDLDPSGKPCNDRAWVECFAQLVGTVMSLWDASQLDAAGAQGEVVPTFINLTDASIKMIGTLPTRSQENAPLQNVLSVSTAGKNRYLFHFNSHHSVKQWTAAIRLAMYEHATLQEAYTGSLIAGKGKLLNNIKQIMMPLTRFPYEDWVRVRFGAGTPWRRCWCVISPPDAKLTAKHKKEERRDMKKSAYSGMALKPGVKGEIRFYDSKKIKKVKPVAIINDAFSAFAIYPQSKPLIEQSTLVKLEGNITINSSPPTVSEGFVFVMPEVHAAVSGFEMMLRWLFPAFDTYSLYGRPNTLVADVRDTRSLMFAMPQERHYGYLEIMDVVGLMSTEGANNWKEYEWRGKLKELTARRLSALSSTGSVRRTATMTTTRNKRNSMPSRPAVMFEDLENVNPSEARNKRSVSISHHNNASTPVLKLSTSPPKSTSFPIRGHSRAGSAPPTPSKVHPPNGVNQSFMPGRNLVDGQAVRPPMYDQRDSETRSSSEEDLPSNASDPALQQVDQLQPPEPVAMPPPMAHAATDKPLRLPNPNPELRRTRSRMSSETLAQLAGASGAGTVSPGATSAWNTASPQQGRPGESTRLRSARSSNENLRRGIMNSGFDRGEGDYSSDLTMRTLPIPSMGKRLPAIMGSPAVGVESSEYFTERATAAAPHPLPSVPEPGPSQEVYYESSETHARPAEDAGLSLRTSRTGPRNRYGGANQDEMAAPSPPLTPFSDSARQAASRSQSPIKRKIISPYVTNSAAASKESSPVRVPIKNPPSPQKMLRKPLINDTDI